WVLICKARAHTDRRALRCLAGPAAKMRDRPQPPPATGQNGRDVRKRRRCDRVERSLSLPYVRYRSRAMTIATMTSKGQITIPAATRSKLRLAPGSKVDFVENEAGEIVLRPIAGDIRRLRGIVKYDGAPV